MRTTIICLAVLLCMSCSRKTTQVQATEDTQTQTLRSELQRLFGRVEIHDTIQPLIIDSAARKQQKQAVTRHTQIDINLTNQKSDTTQKALHKVHRETIISSKNAEKYTILHFLPTIIWLILLLSLLLWRILRKVQT